MTLTEEMDKPASAHFIESHCLLRDPANYSFSLVEKKINKKKKILEVTLRTESVR